MFYTMGLHLQRSQQPSRKQSEVQMTHTSSELEIYKRQGYGGKSGFGRKSAVIVVDFVNGFMDPEQFGGGNIGEAVENTARLLPAARRANVPLAYSRVVYADDGADKGVFCLKSPHLARLTENAHASQIVDALSPEPGDYVVRKTQPSAFFGTNHWSRRRYRDRYRLHHIGLRKGDSR